VTCGRRPIGEGRQTKSPPRMLPARALDNSCDDGVIPLICPTGQVQITIFRNSCAGSQATMPGRRRGSRLHERLEPVPTKRFRKHRPNARPARSGFAGSERLARGGSINAKAFNEFAMKIGGPCAHQKKCKNTARQVKQMTSPISPATIHSTSICPSSFRLHQNRLNSRRGV
jgi:hypothetical protein